MRAWVLDTSAIVRFYVPDGPVPDGLEDAVETAWRGDGALLVPELALAEAPQVLLKKERAGLLRADEVDGILTEILTLPLDVVGHRDHVLGAVELARQVGLTVYDAIFLRLALDRGAELVTADKDLERAYRRAVESRES
ncbi:MAG: type II toxin-antitoxin system VapC family toxin [Deltaproteobacteria bacterium]|nr:type II toxin-antitoxin system VapC family toxin [Deltaproteobacteria bacterium]